MILKTTLGYRAVINRGVKLLKPIKALPFWFQAEDVPWELWGKFKTVTLSNKHWIYWHSEEAHQYDSIIVRLMTGKKI